MTTKATPESIQRSFDLQVDRFSNIETGQTTAVDSPLCMELIARSAFLINHNAKQILEVYRLMCSGKTKWYNTLCDLFNTETNNGENMKQYTDLLKQAVDEVIRVFKKRSTQKLTNGDRGALLIPKSKQADDMNNFELVTWLVIK